MRIAILTFLLPSISALQLAPFYEPRLVTSSANDTSLEPSSHELRKRDGDCPDSYNSCSTLAAKYGGACCTQGSTCSIDKAHNIACCPIGALCTGTISAAKAATTSGGTTVGAATTTGSATGTTTTSGTAATITSTAGVLANPYFPFPVIATTFNDAAACSQAYTACQANYAACTQDLQGNAFAVTVVAPAGGITVAPTAQNLGVASATSICSSLSQAACYTLKESNCAQFGSGTATGGGDFVVGSTANVAGPRQTMGCMAKMGALAGLGMGVVGQMV